MTQSLSSAIATHVETKALNRDVVLGFLNAALATEMLSLIRSKRHYYSTELASEELREEFLEQAIEESMHTDRIVGRILELGGAPDFSAQHIRDFSPGELPKRAADVREVIKDDLDAQRTAVESYRNIVRLIGQSDVATCNVLEDIIRRDQYFMERLAQHLQSTSQS